MSSWHYCCKKCAPSHVKRLDADRIDFGWSGVRRGVHYDITATSKTTHEAYHRSPWRRLRDAFSDLRHFSFRCDVCKKRRRHGFEIYVMGQRTRLQQASLEAADKRMFDKYMKSSRPLR